MLVRGVSRNYVIILVAFSLLLLVLTLPRTTIPQRTGDYVKGLLGQKPKDESNFLTDKWFFQSDLDNIELVDFDFDRLRDLPPHNYHGPGHETFATLYASRDASMHDPYFAAAQQIVYRLLWRQKSRSNKHPVTVFVTQHVNQTQRDVFTAAGAIVRELALRPFEPEMAGVSSRLQDMFSKLEMWRQLDFSRIAYLDCDAIPLMNIDDIFKQAPERTCKYDLLPEADRVFGKDICRYVFAGHPESNDTVNAGVMVFKPEQAMYRRLTRESSNTTGWDTGYLEQALLSHLYHRDGPFPPSAIDQGYNSFPDYREKGIEIKVLHDKMWAHYFDPGVWMDLEWSEGWAEMKKFYESEAFYEARFKDQRTLKAEIDRLPHP